MKQQMRCCKCGTAFMVNLNKANAWCPKCGLHILGEKPTVKVSGKVN